MRWTTAAALCLTACGGPEVGITNLVPEISVAPGALEYGEVIFGENLTQEIFITNAGRGDLEVDLVVAGSDAFTILESRLEVAADPANPVGVPVAVQFSPSSIDTYEAVLTLNTNDKQSPVIDIPLSGLGVAFPAPDISVDPLVLDFGTLDEGRMSTQIVLIRNDGNADLLIESIDQTGSGAFRLVADPSNQAITPGGDYPMVVGFSPTRDSGDSGTLTIPSNDPDQPSIELTLLGNGGGGNPYPEAVIDCPGTAAPPTLVPLDGSASSSPVGGPLTYAWELNLSPSGSQAALGAVDTPTTDLEVDVGGNYEVQLTVFDTDGLASAPDRCFIRAVPEDDIHIELTWDQSGHDLDLHVLEGLDAELFHPRADCHWCNRNPSWGAAGTDDDPRLDLDSKSDGPENINILEPAAGIYPVRVHYWDGTGAVTARVNVYAYGELEWTGAMVLERNQVWEVGQLNWPDGTFATVPTNPRQAADRGCQ